MEVDTIIPDLKTSPRGVDVQNEIKKRDEIIIRLSERLKESVKFRDDQISLQYQQIEDLKLELEKLQQDFHQAEKKLKVQEGHQNGSVETIEFVKGNLLDLQSSLKNVCLDTKPSPELPSQLENIPQCSAISSTETPCELEISSTETPCELGISSVENVQDRKTDNESTYSLPTARTDVQISNMEDGKIVLKPDISKSDLEVLCVQLQRKLEHIEEEHVKELRSRDVEFENRLEDKDDKLDIQELEFKRTLEVTNSEKTDLEFICSQLTREIDFLKEKNSDLETQDKDVKLYLETLKSEKSDLETVCSELEDKLQKMDATHSEDLCQKESEFDNRLKECKLTLESEYKELLETTESEKKDLELVCLVLRKEIHGLTVKYSEDNSDSDHNQRASESDQDQEVSDSDYNHEAPDSDQDKEVSDSDQDQRASDSDQYKEASESDHNREASESDLNQNALDSDLNQKVSESDQIDYKALCSELKQKLADIEKENVEITQNNDPKYEKKVCELKQNLEITTNEKCGLETLCSQLQDKLDLLETEREKLEIVSNENTALRSQLEQEIVDLEAQNHDLMKNLETLTNEKSALDSLHSQLQKELSDLKMHNSNLSQNLETLTNEKAALDTTCSDLKQKLSDLEARNVEVLNSKQSELEAQNQELEKHFETALSERDVLNTSCAELKEKLSVIESQHYELQLKLESTLTEKAVLETSCFELEQKLTDLEAEDCSILNSIKSEHETKISDLEQDLENSKCEKNDLKESFAVLEQKLSEKEIEFRTQTSDLQQNLENLNSEKVALETICSELEHSIQDQQDATDSASAKQSELESKIEELSQKLEILNKEKSSLESLYSEMKQKSEESETQNSEIQNEKKEMETLCSKLQEDLEELKNQNTQLVDLKDGLIAEKGKECSDLKHQVVELQSSYSELIKSKDAELETLTYEKVALEKKCSELSEYLLKVEATHYEALQSKEDEFQVQMEELKQKHDSKLKEQLELSNQEKASMEERCSILEKELKELEEAQENEVQLEKDLQEHQHQIVELSERNLHLEGKCSELTKQLEDLETNHLTVLKSTEDQLRTSLEESQQENLNLQSKCSELNFQIEELEALRSTESQLNMSMEEAQQENLNLQSKCSELTSQIEELKALNSTENQVIQSLEEVQMEKTSLENKCAELSKKLEAIEVNHLEEQAGYSKSLEEVQMEKLSLETKCSELSKKLEAVEANHLEEQAEYSKSLEEVLEEKTSLETKCAELSNQLEELEVNHSDEQAEYSKSLQKALEEKTSLENKCAELSKQLEELQAFHLDELKSKDNQNTKSLEETQSEMVAVESTKLKIEDEISELKLAMRNLTIENTDLESTCNEMKQKLSAFEEKEAENEENLNSLVKEKSEMEKINSELKQEILFLQEKHWEDLRLKEDQLETQKLNLTRSLEILENEKEDAEKSYRDLKMKLSRLEEDQTIVKKSNEASVDEEHSLNIDDHKTQSGQDNQIILEATRTEKEELQKRCDLLEQQLSKMKEDHDAELKLLEWKLKKELSAPHFNSEESDQDLAVTCSQLKQQIENLEEKHVRDLRTQEVELTFKFDQEIAEHKMDQELRFKRFVEATTLEKQQEFIKALQKMRKKYKRQSESCSSLPNGDVPANPVTNSNSTDEIKTVEILSQENKELAEIRDILLKQMDLSQVKVHKILLKNELKSVGKSASMENVSQDRSENDLFMEEIARISNVDTGDMNMEWELISPIDSCTDINNQALTGTQEGFFENDEGPLQNVVSAPNSALCDVTDIPCTRKDCGIIRERYQELRGCLSNNSPQSDSGIGDTQVKDKHGDFGEFESEVVTDVKMSHDLATELRLLKQTNKDLEEKIENQLDIFADEKSNFQKICEALKVQVENLLLAKSHLELELESKNIAILTLSEEFHNSLGQFEAAKGGLDRFIDGEKEGINNIPIPDHYAPSNDDSGSFVREDDCSSLDLILNEPQPQSEGDIEFWDTNFSNRYKKQSFPKQDLQVYEVDPELQLQGHSPTEHLQYLSELEEKEKVIDDYILQVNSLERQLKSSKQFISEQSGERELERDESFKEIQRLRELVDEKDSQLKSHKNLYQEIGDIKERLESQQEELDNLNQCNSDLKQQLTSMSRRNTDLDNHVKVLESELDDRNKEDDQDLETGSLEPQARESSSESTINDNIYESSLDVNNMVSLKKFKSDSEISVQTNCASELKIKQLEDEVLSVQYKLRQEKCVSRDLLNSLVLEQKRYNALLNKDTTDTTSCNTELLDQWVTVSKLQNSLMEEQNYCSKLLDALENLQNKMGRMKIRIKDIEDEKLYLEEKLSEARLQQLLIVPQSKQQMSKLKRLYARYLRAESYRKALIYQKRYLLILIGGYQDTEETTLSMIAKMSCPVSPYPNHYLYYTPALHVFRRTATAIIAIFRMKTMVKKWQRAVKVGSPIVCGTSSLNNGYLSSQSS